MAPAAPLLALLLEVLSALDGSAGVGGVHDTNLAHTPEGAPTEDAAGVRGWAGVGASRRLGGDALIRVGLRYDGLAYPDLGDLSRSELGAEASLGVDLGASTAVVVSSSAGAVWYGDGARSSRLLRVGASLRSRPHVRLRLRVGWLHAWRDAEEPVYSADADRVVLGAEVRLVRGAWLRAGVGQEWADDVFYRAVPASAGTPDSRRSDAFGPEMEVVRAEARTFDASAGIEVSLAKGVYADLALSGAWTSADPGDYFARSLALSVGWRR